MAEVQLWKFAVDALLLLSLAVLAWRISKTPSADRTAARISGLDDSLRRLIGDADRAGSELQDKLRVRQRDLEKLLFDLETVEHRVNRAISTSEERKGLLEQEIGRADRVLQRVSAESSQAEALQSRSVTQPTHPAFERTISATSAGEAVPERSVPHNVYGDPIAPSKPATAPEQKINKKAGLSANVEKSVQNPYAKAQKANLGVEDIYFAAETLLRRGRDVESVARRTHLPLEEVRMISELLESEAAVEQEPIEPAMADPRLGVLSKFRRQVQTL